MASKIDCRVYRTVNEIKVEIISPIETKNYVTQTFEELRPNFKKCYSTVERAIKEIASVFSFKFK
ncbi:hypothetical protein KEJ26_06125 [Candidatus Bathyarchaeota archaeon]|nr:hypothetical protein [Candidatus Bathyarchaeota archaeon]